MRPDLAACYGQERLPRYTSYPTAPHFSASVGPSTYAEWLRAIPTTATASLYLHVPFCRSMCWYCGCNTMVAKRDEPIAVYESALRCEIDMVSRQIGRRLQVGHIHFGGGTPTIMAPESFVDLVGSLRHSFFVLPSAEIAIEIDPRTLTRAMIAALGATESTAPAWAYRASIRWCRRPSTGCRVSSRRRRPPMVCARSGWPGSIST